VIVLLLAGGAIAFLAGAFKSSKARHPTVTAFAQTSTAPTTPAPENHQPVVPGENKTPKPSGPPGPASTLRTYFEELGTGDERKAFSMMSPSYRRQNPSWLPGREQAEPHVHVVSIGTPVYASGDAIVPADFYARDRFASHGSDTACRHFTGTITMLHLGVHWLYEPRISHLTSATVPSGIPGCHS
jgi:hypothetical protein